MTSGRRRDQAKDCLVPFQPDKAAGLCPPTAEGDAYVDRWIYVTNVANDGRVVTGGSGVGGEEKRRNDPLTPRPAGRSLGGAAGTALNRAREAGAVLSSWY